MNTPYEEDEEATPPNASTSIPTALRDNRKPYQKQLAVYLILASFLFERIAFYTIAVNLASSLGSASLFNWRPSHIQIATLIFTGTSYFSTIIFAAISDAKLGRAKTIIVGFALYLIGYILAILITKQNTNTLLCGPLNSNNTSSIINEPCAPWILPTIIIIAIGAGAVQSNLPVLGCDQVQGTYITSRYFDKYMVSINIGGSVAKLGFSFIQGEYEYYIGYLIAAAALVIAAILFIAGWRYYIHIKPYDTVVTLFIPVFINAYQTRSQYQRNECSIVRENTNSATSNSRNALQSSTNADESVILDEQPLTFLDHAKALNGGKFHDRIVDDVKSFGNAFVVSGLFIPYWIIYNQIYTSFQLQGQQMKFSSSVEQKNSTYVQNIIDRTSLADAITIIIGILILNLFGYKFLECRNRPISIATKSVVGMIFACVTMCLAGSIEMVRQYYCKYPSPSTNNSSNLSIYAQLPLYIGMGLSELFAMIASYEYAYFGAPRSAQSIFMSLRFCAVGISLFLGTGLKMAFEKLTYPFDFKCKLDWQWSFFTYFFILAGLQLVFTIILVICQKKYRIFRLNDQKIETNEFLQHASRTPTN